ncbi:MAG: DNA alkylation repair protein [Acidobacteriota bacterium]
MDSIADIRATLAALGTAERATNEKRYLKSDLEFLGVKVPTIRREVRRWLKARPEIGRAELVALAHRLWQTRVHELRTFGAQALALRVGLLTAEDLALTENLLRKANTWAHVDELSVRLAGSLVERFPAAGRAALDRWNRDDNFWLQRASLLALLIPLREGRGDWPRFSRYADHLLEEKEFFLRKAIGWVLREASQKTPDKVAAWVRSRLDRMSGLTFREGTRRLPEEVQAELKAAYAAR